MRYIIHLLILASTFFSVATLHAQDENSYEIEVNIEGFEGDTIKLGYHYGDKQYILDTAVARQGIAVFDGTKELKYGIYFVVIPDHNFFEFLVTEPKFSLKTKLDAYVENMEVKGSKDNQIFFDYLQFIRKKKDEKEDLNKEKEGTQNKKKLKAIEKKLVKLDEEVNAYRQNMTAKNPDSFYVKYLNANDDPKIPEPPKDENGNIDSTFRFKYYRAHFFDNIDFADNRLAYTPLIHRKVTQYLEKMTPQVPDSLNKAVDMILEKAKAGEDNFKYLTVSLLNKYANSKIMGQDAIYVHMIDKYYTTGLTPWVDSVQVFKMKDRADAIRPNLIGKKAPPLKLKDDKGKWHDIYQIEEEYIVLYFWDPDCGHCKKSTPKIKQFHEDYKDKNIKVIAVTTEHDEEKWRNYLEEHQPPFLNLADLKYRNNFRKLYDISGTPRIFILDKERTIIAKRIGADQLPGFMDRVLKMKGK